MGVRQPALLFKATLNLDTAASLREEQLSTGCYVLADVTCRACLSPMGWSYLHASNEVLRRHGSIPLRVMRSSSAALRGFLARQKAGLHWDKQGEVDEQQLIL